MFEMARGGDLVGLTRLLAQEGDGRINIKDEVSVAIMNECAVSPCHHPSTTSFQLIPIY